ncbi:MAG: TrbC/VirB2 family protein [Gammaproteobacteria bacterium]|nr:TrbC/VirB2 family protein [Gammaproteobacteria bacterium]
MYITLMTFHRPRARRVAALLGALLAAAPLAAFAQASPFMTGATAIQANILAWLTPLAIILVMVLGGMAMANRMSWGWAIGAIFGIAIAFGAPQIVSWVRGMFGV